VIALSLIGAGIVVLVVLAAKKGLLPQAKTEGKPLLAFWIAVSTAIGLGAVFLIEKLSS